MEQFEEAMLGSFRLCYNMLKKMCGIFIGDDGLIRLDLAPVPAVCQEKRTQSLNGVQQA